MLLCLRTKATQDLRGPVSGKILSLETDLSSLITLVTVVFSMLKINRGLKEFLRNWPQFGLSHG